MASKNDVTGDTLVSKPTNQAYSDGWDKIFGKKDESCTTCNNYMHTRSKCGNASCIYEKEKNDGKEENIL